MADYLKILTEDIHSADIATLDKNGRPITRIIDIMLYDDQEIYFLTAKGKEFYRQAHGAKIHIASGCDKSESLSALRKML